MTTTEINAVIDNLFAKLEIPVGKGFEYISVLGSMKIIPAIITSLFGIISLVTIFILIPKLIRATEKEVEDLLSIGIVVCIFVLVISAYNAYGAWYDYILWCKSPGSYGMKYITEEIIMKIQ